MNSISKAGFSSENVESPEESGWTKYFEDFFNNHKSSSISSVFNSSSSLVSDATSLNLAAKKVTDNSHDHPHEEFSVNKNVGCRSSNFKKRKKTKAANLVIDDVLEDTASSSLINSLKEKGSSSERKELGLKGRGSVTAQN